MFLTKSHIIAATLALILSSCNSDHSETRLRLFVPDPSAGETRESNAEGLPILIDADKLSAAAVGDEFDFEAGGQAHTIIVDEIERPSDGTGQAQFVLIGHVKESAELYRAFIAVHGPDIVGTISTSDWQLNITGKDGRGRVQTFAPADRLPHVDGTDGYSPPSRSVGDHNDQGKLDAETPAGIAKMDVLVVIENDYAIHTPNWGARVDLIFAKTQRAFEDSVIPVKLTRWGGTVAIINSDRFSNYEILERITPGTSAPGGPNQAIPVNRGSSDLVILIRRYRGGKCGVAWVSGLRSNETDPLIDVAANAEYGYAVISDGQFGGDFCSDYVMAHEIGHLFGSQHDHQTESGNPERGAFDESFGHRGGIAGKGFVTIMGYEDRQFPNKSGVFSSPSLRQPCQGYVCGIASGPMAADNARRFKDVRFKIAGWRGQKWVTIKISSEGTGSGVVTGILENGTYAPVDTGLNCPSICSTSADKSRGMTLTATPDANSTFSGWSTSDTVPFHCGTGRICAFQANNATLIATFVRNK